MTHHFFCQSFSNLFVSELLVYNVGVQIERFFGSIKFAVSPVSLILDNELRLYVLYSFALSVQKKITQSFITVSILVTSISEFLSLLLLNNLGLNVIPASPIALLFSILYQFSRIVPPIYHFRIFGIVFDNKSFTYLLAAQVRHHP